MQILQFYLAFTVLRFLVLLSIRLLTFLNLYETLYVFRIVCGFKREMCKYYFTIYYLAANK